MWEFLPSDTEATLDKVLRSVFAVRGEASAIMDVGTPEGWVRCYGDGRRPEFIEDGADATEAARRWFESKGL